MLRRLVALLLLAVGSAPLVAATSFYFSAEVTATQASAASAITDTGSGSSGAAFAARTVWVKNDGATNEVFVSLRAAGTAATTDRKLLPGEAFAFQWDPTTGGGDGWTSVAYICSTGETTALRIWGQR